MSENGHLDLRVAITRSFALVVSFSAAGIGFVVFMQVGIADGLDGFDWFRGALILISTFWLAWGAVQAMMGLAFPVQRRAPSTAPITGRTIILVPVYNEDPVATFARIAAMEADLRPQGLGDQLHFAILSDTRDEAIALEERDWFARLISETDGEGRIFYRRRTNNRGRKAGNIEDFVRRSGAAYDFALILDADSLMSAATIVEMIRRMEADPKLGLLQAAPTIIRAQSRFGRSMQFSAAFHGPVFGRGLELMQGRSGPFWGHNAMVRVRAFAASCGLPELSGKPPFGGHVMSHDYVEAALLARAGWTVRFDSDLRGSFEEAPEHIITFSKRDRRWCQGNLQHSKIIMAPGLKPWSRFVFLQGILAYIAPVLWIAFLVASVIAPAFAPPPDYFPLPYWPFPVFVGDNAGKAASLIVGVFGLLFLPKLLVGLDAVFRGRARQFGGIWATLVSTVLELVFSSIVAPVLLMYQTRSVAQVLLGRDGGWPAQVRGDGTLNLREAWLASHWIVTTGLLVLSASWFLSPGLVPWLLPVAGPMLLSPVIISWSSQQSQTRLLATPTERDPDRVIGLADGILARWLGLGYGEPDVSAASPVIYA